MWLLLLYAVDAFVVGDFAGTQVLGVSVPLDRVFIAAPDT